MITALRGLAHVALFLGVLELTCRVDDLIRFGTPMMSRIQSSNDLIEHVGTNVRGRPNARFQKWAMNEDGLRGPSIRRDRSTDVIRVVTVGASETFGLTETEGREYPRQLQDSLDAARAREPRHPEFEVLNASLPGMSLPTIEQDIRNRVRAFAPDIVVLYPSPSFYMDFNAPHASWDFHGGSDLPLSRAFQPRVTARFSGSLKSLVPPPVLRWLRQRDIEEVTSHRPAGWRFTSIPEDRLQQFDRDLRTAVGTIRSIGAVPVLASHGNAFMAGKPGNEDLALSWVRFYPRATASSLIGFDSAARVVTLQVARDSNVVGVDVAGALARADVPVFSDFVHFTDAGAALVASTLRDSLLVAAAQADVRRIAARRTDPTRATPQ